MASKGWPALSRRAFLRTTGLGALAIVGFGPLILTPQVRAQPKTLRVLQGTHFVPRYDEWFARTFARAWAEKHDMQVTIEPVAAADIRARAVAEVAAQKGHDLFMFVDSPAVYEAQTIDHTELVQESERKYDKMVELAHKSLFNPKTKRYFGFSDHWVPNVGHYRQDLWDAIGMVPDTWEDVHGGGAQIKQRFGPSIGIGLSQELDTSMALRAIMYSFGSHEQNEEGHVTIQSKETLAAVRYVQALFKEAMTPEVLTWDVSSNDRIMLGGKGSFTMNAISIMRSAERDVPAMSKNIQLAKTPAGPIRRMGVKHTLGVYVIWKFAENQESAKQFLIDLIDNSRAAFVESEFYNFPSFPKTVPDLHELIHKDVKGEPADKYAILGDFMETATNVGYPGYCSAWIDEVFSTFVIPTMFAKVAREELNPQEAIREADRELKRIHARWEKT